jgi:hypothetical protein
MFLAGLLIIIRRIVLLLFVLFNVLFVCKCVLYYCQRVTTQLQLNILCLSTLYKRMAIPIAVYTELILLMMSSKTARNI